MREMFSAIDPGIPVKVMHVKYEKGRNWCGIAWRVTFGREFSLKRQTFRKGDTFVLDGQLRKVGDRWMIVGI